MSTDKLGALNSDQFAAFGIRVQQFFVEFCILVTPQFHGIRQFFVADKNRFVGKKRGVAIHMVRVHMRIYDIQHRQRCHLAYRLAQLQAYFEAAAGINHRHTLAAYDKTDIADVTLITGINIQMLAMMHVNPVGNVFYRKIFMA